MDHDVPGWLLAIILLIFPFGPILALLIGAFCGAQICDCECHDPKSPLYQTDCSCGDRW